MEPVAFSDEELESLSKIFSSGNSDFMLHLQNGSELFADQLKNGLSFLANTEENVAAGVDNTVFIASDSLNSTTNLYHVSQESSYSSEFDKVDDFPDQAINDTTYDQSIHFFMDGKNDRNLLTVLDFYDDHVMENVGGDQMANEDIQPLEIVDSVKGIRFKRKLPKTSEEKMDKHLTESPPKNARFSTDLSRNKLPIQSKKYKKINRMSTNKEKTYGGQNEKSSTSCSPEDDCNSSQKLNGAENSEFHGSSSLSSNGKARVSRGSATDPQCLYARRRRERINQRLRILQSLVPNGTKVDISTMLEEAVHYVKFLQLQIKLLSSDEMWMHAPIANYNGMDIGLNPRISSASCY